MPQPGKHSRHQSRKPLDLWKNGISITEEEGEAICLLALCLQEESVGQRLRKGSEHDIIRKEMDVIHLVYRLDVQGIHPGGILSNIRFAGRHDDRGKRQSFSLF